MTPLRLTTALTLLTLLLVGCSKSATSNGTSTSGGGTTATSAGPALDTAAIDAALGRPGARSQPHRMGNDRAPSFDAYDAATTAMAAVIVSMNSVVLRPDRLSKGFDPGLFERGSPVQAPCAVSVISAAPCEMEQ